MHPAITATLLCIAGGLTLWLLTRLANRSQQRDTDLSIIIREELREETRQLMREIDAKNQELGFWKQKYYRLKEEWTRKTTGFDLDTFK